MTDTENYNEVFKKFPYQLVKQKDCDIRQYRGWIYTKWKAGQFDSFVYLTDGLPLFDEAVKAHTMTEESGDESKFFYTYAVEKKIDYIYRDSDRHPGRGWVDVQDGDTIRCEVNMYRGTKRYSLCSWVGDKYNYDLQLDEEQKPILPEGKHFRIFSEKTITNIEKQIINEYLPHKQKIDDAEFNYLKKQKHHIGHMLETGQSKLKNDDLQNLLTDIEQRLKQLKPNDSREEARNIRMTTLLARLKCI